MRKFLRPTAIILVLMSLLLIYPMPALALDPIEVGPNLYCYQMPGKNYQFGFRRETTFPATPLTLVSGNGILTGEMEFGQDQDPYNSVTLTAGAENRSISWSATLGIDAVIVQGRDTGKAFAYFYDSGEVTQDTAQIAIPSAPGTFDVITAIEFCFDYELTATNTVTTSWTNRVDWTIVKSASAAAASAFANAKPSLTYRVDLTRQDFPGPYTVSGVLTIKNRTPLDVQSFTATATVGGQTFTVPCNYARIFLNTERVCNYSLIVDTKDAGVSSIVITTGPSDPVKGTSVSSGYTFGSPIPDPNTEGEQAAVSDNLAGSLGTFTATGFTTYPSTFTCPDNPGSYTNGVYTQIVENTASITGLAGHSSTVPVTFTCYAPVVTKTASGSYDEMHTWDIVKTVNPTSQNGLAGESLSWTWTVNLSEAFQNENFAVNGSISVMNSAPVPMAVTLTDVLNDQTPGVITPGASCAFAGGTLTIPASSTATCGYTATPLGLTATINTATAALNGVAFSKTEPFKFAKTVKNGTAQVIDSQVGLNQTVQAGNTYGPWTKTYSHTCATTSPSYQADGSYSGGASNTATVTGSHGQVDSASASTAYTCYAPVVSKTVSTEWKRQYDWAISKTAAPDAHAGFAGAGFTSSYAVVVDQTVTDFDYKVSGTITVLNHHPTADMTLASLTDDAGGVAGVVSCGGSLVVPHAAAGVPGALNCTYATASQTSQVFGNTNTATALFAGASWTGTAPIAFSATPASVIGEPTIHVTDSVQGALGTASSDHTFTYSKNFACSTVPADYTGGIDTDIYANQASITETGQVANESVTVTCYAPVVSKTVSTEWKRQYDWAISKTATPDAHAGFAGAGFTSSYAVVVDQTVTDFDYKVSGTITVLNHHPTADMTLASLTDDAGGVAGVVSCGGSLVVPHAAAGVPGALNCTYATASQTSQVFGNTNTATALFAGANWTGTAPIAFSATPASVIGEPTIHVTDSVQGALGSASSDHTFTYSKNFACSTVPADYTGGIDTDIYANQAVITETGLDAAESVTVTCYAPVVSKTATADFTEEHTWGLSKSVAPLSGKALAGSSLPVAWTVDVTHAVTEKDFLVAGQISIQNPAAVPMTVSLSDSLGDGTQTSITGCAIQDSQLTIPANGIAVCNYTASPANRVAGTTTAVVGLGGAEFVGQHALDWAAHAINPTVTLVDEHLPSISQTLTQAATFTVAEFLPCPTSETSYTLGQHTVNTVNTAILKSGETTLFTRQAQVAVECYAPLVTKTAQGTTYRGINWTITKTADQPSAVALAGQSVMLDYTVNLVKELNSELHLVEGDITVTSPTGAPSAMNFSLTDIVVPEGLSSVQAAVDCDPQAPGAQPTLTLAAGESYTCTYTASLASPAGGTNTAFVQLNEAYFSHLVNYTFGSQGTGGSEPESITVSDTRLPLPLGTFTDTGEIKYQVDATCPTDPAQYQDGYKALTVPNTARINETGEESSAAVTLNCYAPIVSKTALASAYQTTTWSIQKTAAQTDLAAFAGQSATADYTVLLTKDTTSGLNVVEGEITITNPSSGTAPMQLTVTDLVQPTGLDPVPAVVDCDPTSAVSASLTLAAGETKTCTYSATLPSATNGNNTVTATLAGGGAFSATIPYTFVEKEYGGVDLTTVHVTDSLVTGDPWVFTNSGSQGYSYSLACPVDPSVYVNGVYTQSIPNTATITETNAASSLSVTLTCYAPVVSKTAFGTYDERHIWGVTKSVTPPAQSGFAGNILAFEWTIDVTEGIVAENFDVSGAITVQNPAPIPMTVLLADTLSDSTTVVIGTCTNGAAYSLGTLDIPAATTTTCSYTASDLPYTDHLAAPGSNTATVTLGNIAFSDTAAVQWTANPLNTTAVLTDQQGALNETITEPGTWTVIGSYDCLPAGSEYDGDFTYSQTLSNTAVVTAGSVQQAESTASITLSCYLPFAQKTALGTYDERHTWGVTKSVSPANLKAFAGGTVSYEWTVGVTDQASYENFAVAGSITVANPNSDSTLTVFLTDLLSDGTPATISTCTGDADLSDGLTIAAGGTSVCEYSAALAITDLAAAPVTNVLTIELPGGSQVQVSAPITWTPTVIRPSVSLDDDLNPALPALVTGSGTFTYPDSYTCPVDLQGYTAGVARFTGSNSATLSDSGGVFASATAAVSVDCYAPLASKTASATWTKTINWTLDKGVTPLSASMLAGETASFTYGLSLFKDETFGSYLVSGAVTLSNPSGAPGAIDFSLTDLLSPNGQPGVPVTLDCGTADPAALSLLPGESIACTYTAALAGPFDGTNTAEVTFTPSGGSPQTITLSAPYLFGPAALLPGSEPEQVRLTDVFDSQPQDMGIQDRSAEIAYFRTLACPTEASAYTDGVYTFTRLNTASLASLGGVPTGDQDSVTVTVTCTLPGSPVQVVKVIDQGSQAIGQFPIQFALFEPGATEAIETLSLNAADVTEDGAITLPFQTLVTPGTWTVAELPSTGWKVASTICTLEVPENRTTSDPFTCTFHNTELSRLRLFKTTNGQVDPTRDWHFILIGAGGVSASTLGDTDGWLEFGGASLDPAQTYTVCEAALGKQWASVWSAAGVIQPGYYGTGAFAGSRCLDIGAGTALPLQPGEDLLMWVDNISTVGAPGSSGYWKNHTAALETLLGRYTFTIGRLQLGAGSASLAARLLDQRDLDTGQKMASDLLYQLAAELLVYRLNQANGACLRPEAEEAALSAQALLDSLGFNGRGAYLPHSAAASMKAADLAKFNNSAVCGK